VDFRSGRGAGMVPVPCGSSGNSAQRSGAVSGVSGRNSTGAQSHMARRPSVTSDAPQSTQRTSFTGGGTGVSDSAGMADDNSNMGLARASSERDASDVFMDELIGVPQADVEKHQTMFVQYDGLTTGQVATEWKQQDAMKVASMAHRKPAAVAAEFAGLPLSCSVRIIQAPAAFARPMVQKKPFRPHFVVRLEVRYQGRIDFPVTMGAFPLSDSLYSKPSSLKPSAALNDSEVEGLLVTQTVTNDMADEATGRGKATEERTLTADFEFPDLKFVKSSRMFKRWLVFSFKIREDHVYVTYDLPTVILSRKTDQFGKAYEKLTGGPPPLKRARVPAPSVSPAPSAPSAPGRASGGLAGSRWGGGARPNVSMMKIDVQQAENWIVSKYHEYLPNAQRTLSDQDIVWLLHKAELNPNVQEAVMVAGHKWEQFEEWYTKCLETLQSVEATWDQTEPEIICGFRIDRRRAEQILQVAGPWRPSAHCAGLLSAATSLELAFFRVYIFFIMRLLHTSIIAVQTCIITG